MQKPEGIVAKTSVASGSIPNRQEEAMAAYARPSAEEPLGVGA
jgi:hypothetical protein